QGEGEGEDDEGVAGSEAEDQRAPLNCGKPEEARDEEADHRRAREEKEVGEEQRPGRGKTGTVRSGHQEDDRCQQGKGERSETRKQPLALLLPLRPALGEEGEQQGSCEEA